MYTLQITSAFKKGYKRMARRGYNMDELNSIIEQLQKGLPLDKSFLDHPLQGKFQKCRECHIQDDWLLIYRVEKKKLLLIAVDTGTHQDIFNE